MKITMEFDLPQDSLAYKAAQNSYVVVNALREILVQLRQNELIDASPSDPRVRNRAESLLDELVSIQKTVSAALDKL